MRKRKNIFACNGLPEVCLFFLPRFALQLGYTIVKIHEMIHYAESAPVMADFMSILLRKKALYEPVPPGFTKESYVENLNEKMKLPEHLKIQPDELKEDSRLRSIAKLNGNAIVGKLIQCPSECSTKIITSPKELLPYFENDSAEELENFVIINDTHLALTVKKKGGAKKFNLKTNSILAARVMAEARVVLFRHMIKLLKKKATIFAMDTDAIYYSLSRNVPSPLPYSSFTGDFKRVYGNRKITKFQISSVKNYIISFADGEQIVKCKGLSLTNPVGLMHFKEGKSEKKDIVVKQQRKRKSKCLTQTRSCLEEFKVSAKTRLKRAEMYDNETLPYGYRNE